MKSIVKILIRTLSILLFLAVGLGLGGYVLYKRENRPPETLPNLENSEDLYRNEEKIFIRIHKGESLISLANRLSDAGLSRSALLWRIFPYLHGGSIKVGEYVIDRPMSASELYALFTSGKVVLHRITIPEGLTSGKIARRLEEAGFCSAEDFLAAIRSKALLERFDIPPDSLEGYLFPETWHFPEGYPAQRIAEDMASLFFKTLDEVYPAHRQEGAEARHQKVILASIVEREAYLKEEASLIAGVFINRLDISMPLQSCATVEYIITEIQGKPHPHRLFDADVAIDHPFNTYRNAGLPPGPIANPGKTALEAVYKPQESDFLYFRLIDANRGEHAFSKTFDEHLEYGLLFNRRSGRN